MRRRRILLAIGLLAALPLHAQEPNQKLRQTKQEIEASRQRHASLKKNIDEMEGDLGKLQRETGSIAEVLKKTQQQQHEIEQRLQGLEKEAQTKQAAIDRRRKQIGALLATTLRVSQVPSYAVLAMKNGLESQVHASRALGVTTRSMKKETDTLAVQLREMAALKADISREKDMLAERMETLESQRMELAGRIDERRRAMQGLHAEEIAEQKRIGELTRQSKDLESLVASLEKERENLRGSQFGAIGLPMLKPTPPRAAPETKTAVPVRPSVTPRKGKEVDLTRVRGSLVLPVAGTVSGRYGQQQASNDTLKGLMLSTPSQAVVTAPYRGEVMFTGPFRDYGQMVIIRHSGRHHTLLAGLSRIDVSPGQFLLEGEPIGAMGSAQEDRRLYVELREDGRPVDPAPWFGGGPRLARN